MPGCAYEEFEIPKLSDDKYKDLMKLYRRTYPVPYNPEVKCLINKVTKNFK